MSARLSGRWRRGGTLAVVVLLVAATAAELPELVQAAKDRNGAEVRRLLREGADVNARAADGATALHWASYWDDLESAEELLAAGAEAGPANDLGATPIWMASMNGSAPMVRRLLAAGADPDAALLSGETPVLAAARTGSAPVLELLLAAGADPNATSTRDQTALMWAASQSHAEAVRVLIAYGADVNARSAAWSQVMAVPPHSDPANQQEIPHGRYTALLFAARVGDVESARLLVAGGADLDATDAWGVSATVLAAHSGFRDLVAYLLEAGADPNEAKAGFSALHLAVMRRDEVMARLLLEHGADANARLANWTPTRRASNDWSIHPSLVGATPFWLAARLSQPAMMRLLAEHGADPRFVHHARYVGAAGAFGAEERVESNTALMAAIGMGGPRRVQGFIEPGRAELAALRLEAVRAALELGVDPHAVNLEGRSALDMTGEPELVALLSSWTAAR